MSLALPIGKLADKVGRARVFVWGHGALVAAYVCAGVATASAASTIGALLLLGLFYAATDGVLAALAGRRAAPNVRASAIGTAQTVVAVARMASSALLRAALVHRRPRPRDPLGGRPAPPRPCLSHGSSSEA